MNNKLKYTVLCFLFLSIAFKGKAQVMCCDATITPNELGCTPTMLIANVNSGWDVKNYELTDPNNMTTMSPNLPGSGNNIFDIEGVVVAGIYTITFNYSPSSGLYPCTCPFEVTAVAPPVIMTSSEFTCFGEANGTATANPGSGDYTYLWNDSNMQTTATATGLPVGSYIVTVTDTDTGCSDTEGIGVESYDEIEIIITGNPVSCNGYSDGVANANVTGGKIPYTFSWDNSANTTNQPLDLPPGLNILTVIDGNQCTAIGMVNIGEPNEIIPASPMIINVSCNDGNDGVINISASGGTGALEYSIDGTNFEPVGMFSNLPEGNYTIYIKDDNDCIITIGETITEPNPLSIFFSNIIPENCDAQDGGATATANGGTSPYTTYLWDNGETTATADSLSSGVHSITITDFNGCPIVSSTTIPNTSALSVNSSSTGLSCFEVCDGQATAIPSGAISYTYLWSDGQTTNPAIELCAGFITVTVTDNNGCTEIETVTLNQPALLTATASGSTVTCFGDSNGTITVDTPSGGTTPYQYSLDGVTFQNSPTFNNLPAGNYDIVVRDANLCLTNTIPVTISNPTQLTASTTPTEPETCYGNDGAFTFTVNNGVSNYDWVATETSGGGTFSDTNSPATGLAAGNYNVIITDGNGCEVTTTVAIGSNITAPPATGIALTTCDNGMQEGQFILSGANDSITNTSLYSVTYHSTQNQAESGTPELSEPHTGEQGDIVYARVYNSVNGCYSVVEVNLNLTILALPGALDFNMESSSVLNPIASCYDRQVLTATIPSPQAGHTYTWSTSGGTAVISGDCVAIELLNTSDTLLLNVALSGCGQTIAIPINMGTEPVPAKALRLPGTNILFCNRNDFATYQWGRQDRNSLCNESIPGEFFQETAFASIDEANYFYWVDVTDDAGCTARIYYVEDPFMRISQPPFVDYGTFSIEVRPNPNNGDFILDLIGNEDRQLELNIYDALGQKVYTETIEKRVPIETVNLSLQDVPQGLYFINVTGTSNLNISEKIMIR